jgi:hypothetical protein
MDGDAMIDGFEGLDLVGYSNKLLAEIRSEQLLNAVTTKHDCNNKKSVAVIIATGGMATPHIVGADVKDYAVAFARSSFRPRTGKRGRTWTIFN